MTMQDYRLFARYRNQRPHAARDRQLRIYRLSVV